MAIAIDHGNPIMVYPGIAGKTDNTCTCVNIADGGGNSLYMKYIIAYTYIPKLNIAVQN